MSNTDQFVDHILRKAGNTGQRTGQYLYNSLPQIVAQLVNGKLFDPFHGEYTRAELAEWIDNHLIFEGNEIVALFDKDRIIWEAPPTTPTK